MTSFVYRRRRLGALLCLGWLIGTAVSTWSLRWVLHLDLDLIPANEIPGVAIGVFVLSASGCAGVVGAIFLTTQPEDELR